MKVLRSTIVVATAIIAAACGDKVSNIVQPGSTAGKINSVQVAPSSATITTGQAVTLTAAVNADVGITTTTAWTASGSAVTLSGATNTSVTVTAGSAASPGVAVCATASATGTASVISCAQVVITAASVTTPATVQIASITGVNLNTPVAVPPGTVAGQINVSVNVNPGTEKLDSVVVFVNGIPAGTQVLTAAQAAALRSAGDAAVADQTTLAPLVFSINTAAYNPTTGAVMWQNGPAVISAVAYGKQGGVAAPNVSASSSVNLLFGNADAWAITQTLSASNTANNAAGFAFRTGAVTVSAVPVLYTAGSAIATATVNYGTAACDLSGSPQRTAALVAPAAGSFAWTATFAKTTGAAAVTNVSNYEYNAACPSNPTGGEGATIAASQYTTTNVGPTAAVAGTVPQVYRLDNRAPATPAVLANPNFRAQNWVNDSVSFNTVTAGATSNNMIAAAIPDAGVGGVVYAAKAGVGTAAVVGLTADVTSPVGMPATATNATDCLLQYSVDKLGNRSAATTCYAFGIDRVAPNVTVDATSIANNSRFAAAPGAEFVVTVVDTGLVGNSGMLPVNPVTGTVAMRGASTTAAAACYIGTYAVATGCSPVAMFNAGAGKWSTNVGATMATAAGPDYYTFNATAFDAAGNRATATTMVTLVDQTAPVVGAASAALSVTGLGWTATAFVNEDLDIQSQWFSANYATATIAPTRIGQVPTIVNGYNAATFINTNFAISQVVNSPFELQANMAATLYPLSGVVANAYSQSNLLFTGAATLPTFPAPAAMALTNWTAFTTPTSSIASNTISSGVTTAATAANPANGTLSVTTTGTTAIFNNPFSRVDFYAVSDNGAGTEYRLIGSTSAITDVDNGAVRTFTYTVAINGLTMYNALGNTATAATNVIAIGFNAAATVGMYTGTYALTIVK